MATPEIEPGWLSAAWAWIAGIGGSLVAAWKYLEARLEKKADKTDVVELLKRIDKTNDHVEKLYENAERDRRFTRDLHDKGMDTIVTNQREIMTMMRSRQ